MIYIATDHAGFDLKNEIVIYLESQNIDCTDMGPFEYDPNDDYPDFILPAAIKVGEDPLNNKAIILGGSGQGEAIIANKVEGVRAIVYYGGPKDIITLSKLHNNANILSLGARFIDKKDIFNVIDLWLNTDFKDEERHVRRINKISEFENNN